jgi:hypothetical protein
MTPPERTWRGGSASPRSTKLLPSVDIPASLAKAERLRQRKLADFGREDLLKTINSDGNVQKSMTAPSLMSQKGET